MHASVVACVLLSEIFVFQKDARVFQFLCVKSQLPLVDGFTGMHIQTVSGFKVIALFKIRPCS